MAKKLEEFYVNNGERGETFVDPKLPSLTRQEFAEECDINALMKRYEGHAIGGPGNLAPAEPMYVDFAELPQDLLGYMNFMEDAQRSFMTLPAHVRRDFDNNAYEFVAFASDPGNLEQMRSWGLAPPAKAPPLPREGVPQPPPEGSGEGSTHGST